MILYPFGNFILFLFVRRIPQKRFPIYLSPLFRQKLEMGSFGDLRENYSQILNELLGNRIDKIKEKTTKD